MDIIFFTDIKDWDRIAKNLVLNIESFLYTNLVVNSPFSCCPTLPTLWDRVEYPLSMNRTSFMWLLGFLLPAWCPFSVSSAFSPCALHGGVPQSSVFPPFPPFPLPTLTPLVNSFGFKYLKYFPQIMTPKFICSPDFSPQLKTHTSNCLFGCQTDISKSPFQTELLIVFHFTTLHLSWWQLDPLGSCLGPKSWSHLYCSFILHIQSIRKFCWFLTSKCIHNPLISHYLPMTALVWAPIISHLDCCNCLPVHVLASSFALC